MALCLTQAVIFMLLKCFRHIHTKRCKPTDKKYEAAFLLNLFAIVRVYSMHFWEMDCKEKHSTYIFTPEKLRAIYLFNQFPIFKSPTTVSQSTGKCILKMGHFKLTDQ